MLVNSYQEKDQGTPLLKCLTDFEIDANLTVLNVNAGFFAKRRLSNLGILTGVKIIKKRAAPLRGPIELIVKGSSLAIGRGLATKIVVKCEELCTL